jgi:hypothetical protein
VLLLLEVLLKQLHDLRLTQFLGVGDQRLVNGDLVVLRRGGTGQDHVVHDAVVGHLDVGLGLLLEALDGGAR